MTKAFCGVGKVPKGKKLGSMKECADAGQVRYYGLKKIDKKLVESAAANKQAKKSSKISGLTRGEEIMIEISGVKGKIRNLMGKLQAEKKESAKKKITKELDEVKEKLEKLRAAYQKFQKSQQKRQSTNKRKTRKSSRK